MWSARSESMAIRTMLGLFFAGIRSSGTVCRRWHEALAFFRRRYPAAPNETGDREEEDRRPFPRQFTRRTPVSYFPGYNPTPAFFARSGAGALPRRQDARVRDRMVQITV